MQINKNYRKILNNVNEQQATMLDMFSDIIHGSKELRLNSKREKAILQNFFQQSLNTENLLTLAGARWTFMILLGGFVTYSILGVIGFIFPQFIHNHSIVVFQLVPTMMFCLAPLAKIVAQSPIFLRADVGLRGIFEMQKKIEAAGGISTSEAREKVKPISEISKKFPILASPIIILIQNWSHCLLLAHGIWI